MAKSFKQILDNANEFEGMISDFDAAVLHSLLEFQENSSIAGNLLETGVYKGKTATILRNHLSSTEKLILIDVDDGYPANFLTQYQSAQIQFFQSSSEEFCRKNKAQAKELRKTCRFMHADGSHTFDNVYNDLKLADKFLTSSGIIVLDDFNNTNYPQVQAAAYYFLYSSWSDLRFFLITNNKGILCRKAMVQVYRRFCFEKLISNLEEMGVKPVASKTDENKKFDVLSIHPREEWQTENIYGKQIYGKYFESHF